MSNSTGAAVRFEKVQKSYDGEIMVVKDLNLDIAPGEFLTMLGPSGSGKSTCLMMLAGFEPATNGEIYLNDKGINSVPPNKRGIGMVFQNYALFPHMSVAENLAFPLKVRGLSGSEIDKKVKHALDMVELGAFGNRRPAQLSGGQQQRVAVARGLVFEPDLILMDEPLGALDKQLREQMQYEIKHIHENLGVTVVYVTHDQTEALTMSDRVAVFEDGRIQQLSPPDELYESPQMSYILISAALHANEPKNLRMEYIREFYEAVSLGKLSLPTPIMAGVRTPTRQFSSCVLIETGDSLDSISGANTAITKYISQRAGTGINAGAIRGLGAAIRNGEAYHTGSIPF